MRVHRSKRTQPQEVGEWEGDISHNEFSTFMIRMSEWIPRILNYPRYWPITGSIGVKHAGMTREGIKSSLGKGCGP